jgi:hypothetical protein
MSPKEAKKGGAAAVPAGDKSRIQRLNGQRLKILRRITEVSEQVQRWFDREDEDSKARDPLGHVLAGLDRAEAALDKGGVGMQLGRLAEMRWEPKTGPVALRVGEQVAPKKWALEKLTRHGAYRAEDLRVLVVTSVHDAGKVVKVSTVASGKKGAVGESLGLISAGWFDRVQEEEKGVPAAE